jgi:hypothetical protein
MEDVGSGAPLIFFHEKSNFGTTYGAAYARFFPGVLRFFVPSDSIGVSDRMSMDVHNIGGGSKYKMIFGGFTWPVNTVLYHGASGSTLQSYSWQTAVIDDNGNTTGVTDPNVAVRKVTSDACSKLKTEYGDNVRIYVVKYRKQTKYKHKISGTVTDFDDATYYNYLNDCATGTAAPYLHDVSTEAQLKSALDNIAANIKSFAQYQEAKNVE